MDQAARMKLLYQKYSKARRRKLKKKLMKSKMAIHTENPGHECEIEWTVENILKLVKTTFSSRLSFAPNCKSKFQLIIKINEDHDAGENYSDVFIGFQRIDPIKQSIRLCYDIYIQNSSGDIYKRNIGHFIYPSGIRTEWCLDLKITDIQRFDNPDLITEDDLRDKTDLNINLVTKNLMVLDENGVHWLYVLPDDTLVLKGVVRTFGCCLSSRLVRVPIHNPDESAVVETDLMKDFEFAFQNEFFTDLQLRCQGELISVHKFVLSARSPILRRMLQRRDDNEIDSPINIEMQREVLNAFLHYLYVGIVGPVHWSTAVELYKTSVCFQVPSLKQHCSSFLAKNVSEKRVCKTLQLADEYEDDVLKMVSINYIKDNFLKVKERMDWVELIKQFPVLASDVLEEITLSIH